MSIDIKYNTLQSGLLEIELENESLTKRKEHIDTSVSQEEARGAKIRVLLGSLQMKQASTLKMLGSGVPCYSSL